MFSLNFMVLRAGFLALRILALRFLAAGMPALPVAVGMPPLTGLAHSLLSVIATAVSLICQGRNQWGCAGVQYDSTRGAVLLTTRSTDTCAPGGWLRHTLGRSAAPSARLRAQGLALPTAGVGDLGRVPKSE